MIPTDERHAIYYNEWREAEKALRSTAFALYHLPDAETCTLITSDKMPPEADRLEALTGAHGFVVAPFDVEGEVPITIIKGAQTRLKAPCNLRFSRETADSEILDRGAEESFDSEHCERSCYRHAFEQCHALLADGSCEKIVLARVHRIEKTDARRHATTYFVNACRQYPHRFTALYATPQTGMWLVSTPEVLLEKTDSGLHTVALAGTMACREGKAPALGEWTEKNVREQQIVAQYVRERLTGFTAGLREHGPHPELAGDIAHLCSDFHFALQHDTDFGSLLRRLHPTPATCGIPRDRAMDAIRHAEAAAPRRCYAGFCGPLGVGEDTRLYVNLRCMELQRDALLLHAGGGLLAESREEEEWLETICKLKSIERICSATILP